MDLKIIDKGNSRVILYPNNDRIAIDRETGLVIGVSTTGKKVAVLPKDVAENHIPGYVNSESAENNVRSMSAALETLSMPLHNGDLPVSSDFGSSANAEHSATGTGLARVEHHDESRKEAI